MHLRHSSRQRVRGAKGFTLVELMVVIVIVAVLAALGFMAGNKVLKKSREAAAIGNMRQVSQGMFSIQADGGVLREYKLRNAFPGEAGYDSRGVLYPWTYEVAELLGYGRFDSETWGAKFIWTTDPNETAFHDPTADWEIVDTEGVPNSRSEGTIWTTAHFGYNIRLGTFINPWNPAFQKGEGGYDSDEAHVISEMRYPSDLIYLAQSAGSGNRSALEEKIKKDIGFQFKTNGAVLVTPWKGGDGTPAVRVRGGANCVFADGSIRWINTKKLYEGSWDSPHFDPDSKGKRKDIYK